MGNTNDTSGRKANDINYRGKQQRTKISDFNSRHPSHDLRKRHDIRAAQDYESLCNVHRYLDTLKTKLDRQRLLAGERMGLSNYELETIINRLESLKCRLAKSCENYKKLIFNEESTLQESIAHHVGDWNPLRQVFVDSLMIRQEATKVLQSDVVEVTRALDQFHPLRDYISCVKLTNIKVDMVVETYLNVVGSHGEHLLNGTHDPEKESCLSNEFKVKVGLKRSDRSVLDDASTAVQDADVAINQSKLLIKQTEACSKFFVEADKLKVSFFTEIERLYECMANSDTVKHMKQIKCDSDLMCRRIEDRFSALGTSSGLAHDNECLVVECKCTSLEAGIPELWENHFHRLDILKMETDILEAMVREINTKTQTYKLIMMEYAKKVGKAKQHYQASVNKLYNLTVGQLDIGFVTSDECSVERNHLLNTRAVTLKQSNFHKLPSTERHDNSPARLYRDLFSRCDAFVEKVERLGQFDMSFPEAPTEYCNVSDNVEKFEKIEQNRRANGSRFCGAVADQHNSGFDASKEKKVFKVLISLGNADRSRTNERTFDTIEFKCSPVAVVPKINKPLAFVKNKDYIWAHGASMVERPERLVKLSNNLISDLLNKYCVCQLRFIQTKLPSLRIESQAAILLAIDRRINFCEHILVARQDAIFNLDLFNCSICLDDVQPGDGLVLSECLHTFCKLCLNHYVRASASETASVTCPFVYSDLSRCSGFINHHEMKSFLTDAEYESVLKQSLLVTECGMNNSVHCGCPDCDFWAVVEAGQPRPSCFLDCPTCGRSTCLKCSNIHSKLFYCDKQRNEINNKNWKLTEEAVQRKLSDGVAMKCPGCGVVIEKNGGCDNMTCSKCKRAFKWTGRAS